MNTKTDEKKKHGEKLPEEKKGIVAAIKTTAPTVVDYGEYAENQTGFQNQTQDDVSIPFIGVLQAKSPEVEKDTTETTKSGMLINRTTGEIYEGKKGILFVPAITEHCYTEWIPKDPQTGAGGGFVGRLELNDPMAVRARNEAPFKKFRMPNGHDLAETFYVFGLQVDEDDGIGYPAGLAFGSSFIGPYKSWMYIARSIQVLTPSGRRQNPPLFAHVYRITTRLKEKNNQRWMIPVIGFANGDEAETSRLAPPNPATGDPGDPLFTQAVQVMNAYTKGEVKVDFSRTEQGTVVEGEQDEPKKAEAGKAPF